MTRLPTFARRLGRDRSGVALLEFAFVLPIFVMMSMTGAELTNYITVRMRVSQMALQIADNAARMGSGTATQAKQVSETDINDVFIGAQIESAGLDLKTNGRVVLSDLETDRAGATTYKIAWQRCYGAKTYVSPYSAGQTGLSGIGPTGGTQVTAQDSTPTMYVEVYYVYKPILSSALAPKAPMTEIASMSVRDRRDLTRIYNTANATKASC